MLRRLVPTGAAGAARAVGAARWLQTAQADPVTLRRALLYLPGELGLALRPAPSQPS